MSENGVYPQWNSHLIGIMISKTIGFFGVLTIFRQTHMLCCALQREDSPQVTGRRTLTWHSLRQILVFWFGNIRNSIDWRWAVDTIFWFFCSDGVFWCAKVYVSQREVQCQVSSPETGDVTVRWESVAILRLIKRGCHRLPIFGKLQ